MASDSTSPTSARVTVVRVTALAGLAGAVVSILAGAPSWLSVVFVAVGAASQVTPARRVRDGEADAVGAIARGDLAAAAVAGPEWQQVASDLGELVRPVQAAGEVLSIAGAEITVSGKAISDSARRTTEEAATIATAAGHVSRQITELADANRELSDAVSEISRTVHAAAEAAGAGNTSVQVAAQTMTDLGRSSEAIGEIVRVINSIAGQTNLLALNATIEAARAGEYGKGFAVVASEVKDLAQETSQATQKISAMVSSLLADSQRAIHAVDSVSTVFATITDLQTTIASAVEQQAANSDQLSATTSAVARDASGIAGSIATVESLAATTAAEAGRSLLASDEVHRLARSVQQSFERWTLPSVPEAPGSYRVSYDRATNQIDIAVWGVWDEAIARAYSTELLALFQAARPGWVIRADMLKLVPFTPPVQAIFERSIGESLQYGIDWSCVVVPNPVLAMQMQRASDAAGAAITYVTELAEADRVLARRRAERA